MCVPYSRGQKNDFRDAKAIAEAVQRPTMKFVATKTAEQLDLQALHRVRERLVSQRTGIINQIRAFLLIDDAALAPDWTTKFTASSDRS
jgi:transposase